jgi:tripartite-type tricarboxylate transporter receptor subunit TctC
MPFVSQGKMRAIANTAAKRSKWLPDMPTVAELGYPGFDAIIWYALMLPSGTPERITARVREETLKALQHPDVQSAMDRQALVITTSTPAQFATYIRTETETWRGVIEEAKIRVD